VIDQAKRALLGRIAVGDHPNAMLLTADQRRLYVACANTDQVVVIDCATDRVLERISLRPYELAPFGSTPNGLALAADERSLFVANATNNDVAVVELAETGSHVAGVIPVGWYPTAVCVHHNKLYVANGKGLTSKANPHAAGPYGGRQGKEEYIGGLFNGMLSMPGSWTPIRAWCIATTDSWKRRSGWRKRKAQSLRSRCRAVEASPL